MTDQVVLRLRTFKPHWEAGHENIHDWLKDAAAQRGKSLARLPPLLERGRLRSRSRPRLLLPLLDGDAAAAAAAPAGPVPVEKKRRARVSFSNS